MTSPAPLPAPIRRRLPSEPWRAVARHAGWRIGVGVVERVPNGVVHAKRIGSSLTACGEASAAWQVFWSAAFPDSSDGVANCHACLTAVGAQ